MYILHKSYKYTQVNQSKNVILIRTNNKTQMIVVTHIVRTLRHYGRITESLQYL